MPVPFPPPVLAMVEQNQFPAALLDQFGAMSFLTVGAAQRLGVFDALAEAPAAPAALAARLGTDTEATGVLLEALVAYDYVVRDGAAYANGPQSDTWLRAGGHDGFAAVVTFWHDALTELWADLPTAVRTGHATHDFYDWLVQDAARLRGFGLMQDQAAADLAGPLAALVAPMVTAEQPRILDVGGGWGRFAEALCVEMPSAGATVVELSQTAEQGAERVATAGMADRISFRTGDIRSHALPGKQDVVLLINVLHTFNEETASDLVRRGAAALEPGGLLVVVDHLADLLDDADPIRQAQGRGFDLHLLQTQSGQLPTFTKVKEWIEDASLEKPDLQVVPELPISHIVTSRVGAGQGQT